MLRRHSTTNDCTITLRAVLVLFFFFSQRAFFLFRGTAHAVRFSGSTGRLVLVRTIERRLVPGGMGVLPRSYARRDFWPPVSRAGALAVYVCKRV